MKFSNIYELSKFYVLQKKECDTCGACCLEMVYKLKGKNFQVEQILKDFNLGEKGGETFPPQLARHLRKSGIKTKLIISNPYVLSPAWKDLSNPLLIEYLKDWLTFHRSSDWRMYACHLLFYLQEAGEVNIFSYTKDDLVNMLNNKSLLILCVANAWLWGHKLDTKNGEVNEITGSSNSHFILITAHEGNEFIVMDPFPSGIKNRDKIYKMNENDLVNASLIWSSTVLEILK